MACNHPVECDICHNPIYRKVYLINGIKYCRECVINTFEMSVPDLLQNSDSNAEQQDCSSGECQLSL